MEHFEKEERSDAHNHKHKTHKKPKKKSKVNFWKVSTIVLLVVLIFFNYSDLNGSKLSKEEAGINTLDFVNKELLQGQSVAKVVSVAEENGLYNLKLSVSGQEVDSYVTKDGKIFFPQAIKISEFGLAKQDIVEPTEPVNAEEVSEFVSCLKKADLKIYGANWCGWTKKLVTMFGGFDAVTPIYIECTENEELCSAAKVSGYPTITIAGEKFAGERTFAAFGEATGCTAPTGVVVEDTGAGGCDS